MRKLLFFFLKKVFLFFHFSALLKCCWPIWASSLKSHSPAGRIYSPLATGRVLMKRLIFKYQIHKSTYRGFTYQLTLQCQDNPPVSIQKRVILLHSHSPYTSEVHVVTQLRSVCKAFVLSRHINKCSRYHLSHGDSGI